MPYADLNIPFLFPGLVARISMQFEDLSRLIPGAVCKSKHFFPNLVDKTFVQFENLDFPFPGLVDRTPVQFGNVNFFPLVL